MKLSKILLLIFMFCGIFSGVSFSKTLGGMDMSNASIQLLKQLNDNGAEVRKNDTLIEKPDVSADTSRTKAKKQEFYDMRCNSFPSIYMKDVLELPVKVKDVTVE